MNPQPSGPWRRHLLRFSAVAAVLGALAVLWQAQIVRCALPLFETWFEAFDGTYRTEALELTCRSGECAIDRSVSFRFPHLVQGRPVFPDPSLRLHTAIGGGLVLEPLVLGLALSLAWPWRKSRMEIPLRCLVATPLLLAVVVFDGPALLYGRQWMNETRLLHLDDAFSLVIQWSDFMNSGGRFAAAALAAGLSIHLAALAFRRQDD